MNILALDLSLTATGWAMSGGQSGVYYPPKGAVGVRRLIAIRNAMLGYAAGAELIVIEGYAYGAKGSAILNIAEMGGVVRVALSEAGYPIVEVPPACVKLFATSKGNAKKDEVLAAAIRKLQYAGHDHNEADALFLLALATSAIDGAELTEYQQRAIAKIQWPKIPRAA